MLGRDYSKSLPLKQGKRSDRGPPGKGTLGAIEVLCRRLTKKTADPVFQFGWNSPYPRPRAWAPTKTPPQATTTHSRSSKGHNEPHSVISSHMALDSSRMQRSTSSAEAKQGCRIP